MDFTKVAQQLIDEQYDELEKKFNSILVEARNRSFGSGGGGSTNAENVGDGADVYKGKASGGKLLFKTLTDGDGVSLTETETEIEIAASTGREFRTTSISTSILAADQLVIADTAGITVTLPTPASRISGTTQKTFTVANMSDGDISLSAALLNFSATIASGATREIATDGTNFFAI